MDKEDLEKSVFEQHWVHSRHIESERMWIMGIWLALTGAMLKEIWMVGEPEWGLQTLKSIAVAHLVVTVAVLGILSKLQLEYDRHNISIRKTAGNDPKYKFQLGSVWNLIGEKTGPLLNCVLTIGAISAAILILGIVFDLKLLTRSMIDDRLICGFGNPHVIFLIWLSIFGFYQIIFYLVRKELQNKIDKEDGYQKAK